MGSKLTKCLSLVCVFISSTAHAELKYCKGTVYDLVVRDSHESIQLRLKTNSGISSWARVGGTILNDNQQVQASMLIAAYLAGNEVMLELNASDHTFTNCENFEHGLPVRYVGFRP